jgi:hypothetical protein
LRPAAGVHGRPAEAIIPETLGLDGGVWYRIRQGMRELVVWDEYGLLRAYPLVEPATPITTS